VAQLNVGRLRAPIDDPRIDDFRSNLASINALADASPGFVWRLQDESGNATGISAFEDALEISTSASGSRSTPWRTSPTARHTWSSSAAASSSRRRCN
jgi:hypothetical protein